MTEIIMAETSQDKLATDDFLLHESPKKKLNSSLGRLNFLQLVCMELCNTIALKMQKTY